MSGVMPWKSRKVGKEAMDGKRGMPLPLPMAFMPLGFGGFGAQFLPFPSFPFPPAHPPNKSAKLARATAFVDGTVDAGAKKRGRPRKWRDGYLYIYCLPPAGGRYAPKVINAPTAQS
jgi:hypothetical protein